MQRFFASLILFVLLVAPTFTHAGILSSGLKNFQPESGYSTAGEYDVSFIVGRVINTFLGLLGTIFLVLLVHAGYLWLTAAGEEEQVKKAKSLINQAVIGLLVVLGAGGISFFVFDELRKGI